MKFRYAEYNDTYGGFCVERLYFGLFWVTVSHYQVSETDCFKFIENYSKKPVDPYKYVQVSPSLSDKLLRRH